MKRPQGKRSRPEKVSNAIKLLYLTVILGVINVILMTPSSLQQIASSGFGIGFLIFVDIFVFAFMVFFIYMIAKGKNWARIIFLIIFIIGIPFSIPLWLQLLST